MTTLYLMIGNIGSGKTTIAKSLHAGKNFAMYISDDEICTMLNGEYTDKYWTDNHKKLYAKMLHGMVANILEAGYSCILDSSLHCISKGVRGDFIKIAKRYNARVVAYDISHPKALERGLAQDRSGGGTAWKKVFDLFEREYDEPSMEEGIDAIVIIDENETL